MHTFVLLFLDEGNPPLAFLIEEVRPRLLLHDFRRLHVMLGILHLQNVSARLVSCYIDFGDIVCQSTALQKPAAEVEEAVGVLFGVIARGHVDVVRGGDRPYLQGVGFQ